MRAFTGTLPALFALAASGCALPGCQSSPAIAGRAAGQALRVAVDSELAACYVNRNASNCAPIARERLARELATAPPDPADREAYAALAARTSLDFATLRFAEAVQARGRNADLRRRFNERVETLRSGARPGADLCQGVTFAFVPGFAYKRDPSTGAALALQREAVAGLGCRTYFIDVDEIGSVAYNAAFIARRLTALAETEARIIVVSASKGGPETALALAQLQPDVAAKVFAWVNVGGILRGTPLADQARRWPQAWLARTVFWFLGFPRELFEDLSTERRRSAFDALTLPRGVRQLNYLAAPLSGAVQPDVRGRYQSLAPLGPNDGLTLLGDAITQTGDTIVELGSDHYFRDPDIALKTQALAWILLADIAASTRPSAE